MGAREPYPPTRLGVHIGLCKFAQNIFVKYHNFLTLSTEWFWTIFLLRDGVCAPLRGTNNHKN